MKNNAKPESKSPLSIASRNGETKVIRLINPRREELTSTILKSFPAFQHLSVAEAEERCTAIRTFARLLFEYLADEQKTIPIDNQHVISLASSSKIKFVPITRKNEKGKAA